MGTIVFVMAVIRVVLNGVFDKGWYADWPLIFELTGFFGIGWFLILSLYTHFRLRANAPVEAILTQELPQSNEGETSLTGFVAMEYYGLILNRTFVVFIASEGLYGWKAAGAVNVARSMYFAPYANMLKDPELMRNRKSVQRLSHLKGGFFIPRPDIISVDVINKQKWGMGPIPHSGRVKIHTTSGRSREFVLLGSVDADSIQQRILHGTTLGGRIPDAPHVSLPYVARYEKKFCVPMLLFWTVLSAYFAWNLTDIWRTSNWALGTTTLAMIGVPVLLVLEFFIQNVKFTDTEIQRTSRVGKITTYPYSTVRKLSTASGAFVVIELSDGRRLKLYSWQGNPREVLSILQTKTKLTVA